MKTVAIYQKVGVLGRVKLPVAMTPQEPIMDKSSKYEDIHAQVRTSIEQSFPGSSNDDERVFETLMAIETIRGAASKLMNIGGSELACEMLLFVAGEAQLVKLNRSSEFQQDDWLFEDCRQNDLMYELIRVCLKQPRA